MFGAFSDDKTQKENPLRYKKGFSSKHGRGGIRTLDTVSRISVFKTDALNHSATLPYDDKLYLIVANYE